MFDDDDTRQVPQQTPRQQPQADRQEQGESETDPSQGQPPRSPNWAFVTDTAHLAQQPDTPFASPRSPNAFAEPSAQQPTGPVVSGRGRSAFWRKALALGGAMAIGAGLTLGIGALTGGFGAAASGSSSQALPALGNGYGVNGSRNGSSGSGQSNGLGDDTIDDSGRTGTSSAGATAASAEQQRGAVIIETVLSYGAGEAAGSGFVLSSDGIVVTNHHVVESATQIKVTVASTGTTYTAKVLGSDSTKDVALLQLQDASGLEAVSLDDDGVNAGDTLTAIGNAEGKGQLVAAAGTVSATNKTITASTASSVTGAASGSATGGTSGGSSSSSESETLSGLIEFGAAVVSGDSGGPVLDAEGEVTAMTVAASSGGQTVGYAIPITTVSSVVQQIENKDASGSVRIGGSPFLGVSMQSAGSSSGSVSSNRGSRSGSTGSSAQTGGAAVAGVVDETPAAEAGITAGSTITAIDGQTVGSAEDLSTIIAKHAVGDHVSVTWADAQGTSHTKTVTLAEGPVQ
ncbi:S1C family serine protease [Pseudoclavibacter sp. 13-3]|uniref:S1C family serine protease n=1 Tax=Pseudoclavibacter sp. 13-3 TaxID=2901228 RepID=UPI001E2A7D21|nr:trypsin-like peptidase domain-containing protein [Pseudoclavibacter sp. 13-3]MCD7101108.1 S1C family serine protease [Pseudoclavibacter sp. 13-3]